MDATTAAGALLALIGVLCGGAASYVLLAVAAGLTAVLVCHEDAVDGAAMERGQDSPADARRVGSGWLEEQR